MPIVSSPPPTPVSLEGYQLAYTDRLSWIRSDDVITMTTDDPEEEASAIIFVAAITMVPYQDSWVDRGSRLGKGTSTR